jgi:hypothetical protein
MTLNQLENGVADPWPARLFSLMRIAQWMFFVDVAVLLVPSTLVRSLVIVFTAPAIVVAGAVLLLDWHGAIASFGGELRDRNYRVAKAVTNWPNYFWRAVGVGITIVGVTVLVVGITGIA